MMVIVSIIIAVFTVLTLITVGYAHFTVGLRFKDELRLAVGVLRTSGINVLVLGNYRKLAYGYGVRVISYVIASAILVIVVSYNGESAIKAGSDVEIVSFAEFVDVALVIARHIAVHDVIAKAASVSTCATVNSYVAVKATYSVVAEIVGFINHVSAVTIIILLVGVITVCTGGVNGYTHLAVFFLAIIYEAVLIIVVNFLIRSYVAGREDLNTVDHITYRGISDAQASIGDNVSVCNIYESTIIASGGFYAMMDSVIIGVEHVINH